MKIIVAILTVCLSNDTISQVIEGAAITSETRQFNFGDVIEGEKKEHVFEIGNSGNKPLILDNVLTSCGCTATEWPRNPIKPGETAIIRVMFNSTGKIGNQRKIITILSNAVNGREEFEIRAHVLPRKSIF